jgi:mannose-6-phosphate isomerase-like protein (cupin superfamily)
MFRPTADTAPFDWHGLVISDRTATVAMSSSVATVEVPPGARHPRAWSDRSDKYYVVMEGRVHFVVGGETSELGPADVCIVPRGEVFAYENRTPRPARLALVHTPRFDPEAEHLE